MNIIETLFLYFPKDISRIILSNLYKIDRIQLFRILFLVQTGEERRNYWIRWKGSLRYLSQKVDDLDFLEFCKEEYLSAQYKRHAVRSFIDRRDTLIDWYNENIKLPFGYFTQYSAKEIIKWCKTNIGPFFREKEELIRWLRQNRKGALSALISAKLASKWEIFAVYISLGDLTPIRRFLGEEENQTRKTIARIVDTIYRHNKSTLDEFINMFRKNGLNKKMSLRSVFKRSSMARLVLQLNDEENTLATIETVLSYYSKYNWTDIMYKVIKDHSKPNVLFSVMYVYDKLPAEEFNLHSRAYLTLAKKRREIDVMEFLCEKGAKGGKIVSFLYKKNKLYMIDDLQGVEDDCFVPAKYSKKWVKILADNKHEFILSEMDVTNILKSAETEEQISLVYENFPEMDWNNILNILFRMLRGNDIHALWLIKNIDNWEKYITIEDIESSKMKKTIKYLFENDLYDTSHVYMLDPYLKRSDFSLSERIEFYLCRIDFDVQLFEKKKIEFGVTESYGYYFDPDVKGEFPSWCTSNLLSRAFWDDIRESEIISPCMKGMELGIIDREGYDILWLLSPLEISIMDKLVKLSNLKA